MTIILISQPDTSKEGSFEEYYRNTQQISKILKSKASGYKIHKSSHFLLLNFIQRTSYKIEVLDHLLLRTRWWNNATTMLIITSTTFVANRFTKGCTICCSIASLRNFCIPSNHTLLFFHFHTFAYMVEIGKN